MMKLFIIILVGYCFIAPKSEIFAQSNLSLLISELEDSTRFSEVNELIIDGRFGLDYSSKIPLVKKCINLKHILIMDISNANFIGIFCSNRLLESVEFINVSRLSIPDCLASNVNLDTLQISLTNLVSIPSGITNLSNLKTLGINSSRLRNISCNELNKMANLKALYLSNNRIRNLDFLECLQSLEVFIMRNGNLKRFYLKTNMNSIREIDLSENPLIGFSGLKFNPNLERLYLSGCKLKGLPKELIELKKLLVLDISFNKIQNYSEFSKISTLRELNLSSCDLKILPDDLKYLKNLKILLLDKNLGLNTNTVIEFLIKEIPELEELSIANCGVEKIPESIVSLSKLKCLNITGNMFSKEKIEQLKSVLPMCKIINSPPISSH